MSTEDSNTIMLSTEDSNTIMLSTEDNNMIIVNISLYPWFLMLFYSDLKYIDGKDGYFLDYFENVWNLYVLVTTANSPDIM